MRLFFTIVLIVMVAAAASNAAGKNIVRGVVTHESNEPLAGANVFIKDSYDGATANADGRYQIKTSKTGRVTLVARYIGHEQFEKEIDLTDTVVVNIKMKDVALRSETVVVTAGALEAGDESKSVIFSALDISSTAGTGSDIVSAFQTLPGVTKVGEGTGLFVRGGEGRETSVIIDGNEAKHPFYSSVPDLSSRGRFSPFYFKGTYFSTGGYSAEYGKGLSSAMILNTIDLPDLSYTHIDLMPMGVGAGHTELWKNSSFGLDLSYYDLGLYNSLNKSRLDWGQSPIGAEATMTYRYRNPDGGMLKSMTSASYGTSELNLAIPEINSSINYKYKNTNLFSSLIYTDPLSENWALTASAAYGLNSDKANTSIIDSTITDNHLQAKIKMAYLFGELSSFNFGSEFSYYRINNVVDETEKGVTDRYAAAFTEFDLPVSKDLAFRVGMRGEYSSFTDRFVLAPRLSGALKIGRYGTLSAAAGRFYQAPEYIYFPTGASGGWESSEHYIMNYQVIAPKRTLRAEVYYKNYSKLTMTVPETSLGGSGYATGLDLFWRDKETIDNFDYWFSYSYLDTKRRFNDYPVEAMPAFAAEHSFSGVFKVLFPSIGVNVAMTYHFMSGRPYYNPNNPVFLGDRTKPYHDVSLSGYYITKIFGAFAVFVVTLDNVFAIDNVFTYRYSYDGTIKTPVKPPYDRVLFFGVFISFGRDNTEDY